MKERINPEEFAKFLDEVLNTKLFKAKELSIITKIDQATISRAKHTDSPSSRRPDEYSQRKIINGIVKALDIKWNTFTDKKKEKAREIYDQCLRYLYDDELDDPDLTEEDYLDLLQEKAVEQSLHAHGVSELVEKALKELMELEPAKLRWLYRYYGSINKYFSNDLLAIKQGIYPKDFTEEENSITVSEDMFSGDGHKKTLNCFFFTRYSYDKYIISSSCKLSREEKKTIKSYFGHKITEYIIRYNSQDFDEP